MRIAVIGTGYMGSAHTRVLKRISDENPELIELAYVVDVDINRAQSVARRYGGKPLSNVREIPCGEADLAFIATPTEHHYSVFRELIDRDVKGFFIEKPLTRNLKEALELIKAVEENGIWVNVGHIERFNPAVQALHKRVKEGFLGEVLTVISRRVGPFIARVKTTDVIYDLGIHEIDNSLTIYRRYPNTLRSYTLESLVSNLTDYALIILGYKRGFSSIEVNRVTPFKQRIMYLTCSKAVAYLDYMNQELKIYMDEHEINVRIKKEEPLYLEDLAVIKYFIEKREPPIDIYQAFAGLFLCEKALESTRTNREIVLEEDNEYRTYRDIIEKGLYNFNKYIERL